MRINFGSVLLLRATLLLEKLEIRVIRDVVKQRIGPLLVFVAKASSYTAKPAPPAHDAAGRRRSDAAPAEGAGLCLILLVTHLFHPIDSCSVELLLNGYMGHRRGRRRSVPVLLAWRKPDHVTRMDLLDGTAQALRASAAGGDDQRLTKWMRMPCGTRAGLEGDAGTNNACWIGRVKQHIDAHSAREVICGALC